jgi:hypothetical protein
MKLYTSGEGDVLRYYQHFLVLIKSPLDSCRLSEEERHSECFGSVSSPRIAPYSFFPHLIAKPNRQEYPSASRNCLFNFAHDVFTASPFFSHSTSGMTSRTREAMVPSDFPNVGSVRSEACKSQILTGAAPSANLHSPSTEREKSAVGKRARPSAPPRQASNPMSCAAGSQRERKKTRSLRI